jgi:hypothetical protein
MDKAKSGTKRYKNPRYHKIVSTKLLSTNTSKPTKGRVLSGLMGRCLRKDWYNTNIKRASPIRPNSTA